MSFRLPAPDSLDPLEHAHVVAPPIDRDLLVAGAPGTGKTTLAIHRTQHLATEGRKAAVVLALHGKPQRRLLERTLTDTHLSDTATPYAGWIVKRYAAITRKRIPTFTGNRPDYAAAGPTLLAHFAKRGPDIDHLILDDAHLIPPAALAILRGAARHVTAFTDPGAGGSDVGAALGIPTSHPLTRHHRLTREVAAIVNLFREDAAGAPPIAPERSGPRPEMIEVESASQAFDHVTATALAHPDARIGVIVPDGRWHQTIQRVAQAHAPRGTVEILRDSNRTFTFDRTGVAVLTYDAAPGTEFDMVFVPLLQTDATPPDDATRQALYVACSRTRSALYLLHPRITDAWTVHRLAAHEAALDWFTLRDDAR